MSGPQTPARARSVPLGRLVSLCAPHSSESRCLGDYTTGRFRCYWCGAIGLADCPRIVREPVKMANKNIETRIRFSASRQKVTGSKPGAESRHANFFDSSRTSMFNGDFGGREGIRTPGLLIANSGENKLRQGATIT